MTLARPHALPVALPQGPAHYWKMMQTLSKRGFTIGDIALCSEGVAYSTVKDYARYLLDEGYIVKVGTRKTGYAIADVYSVKKAVRSAPAVRRRPGYTGQRGAIQTALWNAMRTLASFTLIELQATASTEEHPIRLRTAEEYVRRLVKAGAVEVVEPYRKGAPGASGARRGTYRLSRAANTGPLPLKIFDARVVFDPNKNRVIGEAVVAEARS